MKPHGLSICTAGPARLTAPLLTGGAEQPEVVQRRSGTADGSGRPSRPKPRATAAGLFGRREALPEQ